MLERGYAVVPNVLPKASLNMLSARLDSLLQPSLFGDVPLCTLDLLLADRRWLDVFALPAVAECLEAFVGLPAKFVAAQCVVVNPHSRAIAGWHRDVPNKVFDFHGDSGVRLLLPFDSMDHHNGATMVIPGSHTSDHPSWNLNIQDVLRRFSEDIVSIEASAGDAIVLHPSVIHRPGFNSTNVPRRVISSHWVPESTDVTDAAGFLGSGSMIKRVVPRGTKR